MNWLASKVRSTVDAVVMSLVVLNVVGAIHGAMELDIPRVLAHVTSVILTLALMGDGE